MNILHVVPTYLPAVRYGGPIYAVHGLCRALAARGHRVQVYTTNVDGPGDSDVRLGAPVLIDGVAVNYFPSRYLRRLYFSAALGRALRTAMQRVDIVHLHSVFLWPTLAAARGAEAAQVPYVLSPRGMLVRELIRRRSPWVKQLWIRLVETRTVARAAAMHFTSSVEQREFEALGLPFRRALVLPNGHTPAVEPAQGLTPAMAGLAPADTVLFLSRMSWKKGADRLIRAARHVPQANFVFAGGDEEGLVPQLEALARTEGVAHRVRFIGAVYGDIKQQWYRQAALLVLPSLSENFGNVVLEALAEGCPAVLTPEVGLAQSADQAGCAAVTSGEPVPLAQAINALLGAPERRRQMSERGRLFVEREYSWAGVARQMETEYARLSEEAAARAP